MTTSWTLAMGRDDFVQTALVYAPMPDLSDGEVRLRADRIGLSANDVTHAVLGQPLRYRQFFAPEARPALRAVRFLRQQCCQLSKRLYHSHHSV
jgi:hypothetical protein